MKTRGRVEIKLQPVSVCNSFTVWPFYYRRKIHWHSMAKRLEGQWVISFTLGPFYYRRKIYWHSMDRRLEEQ
jgi:hypothetical protein